MELRFFESFIKFNLRGFLFGPPNIFGAPMPIRERTSLINSIMNSALKKLKNIGTEKLNHDILVDTGINWWKYII